MQLQREGHWTSKYSLKNKQRASFVHKHLTTPRTTMCTECVCNCHTTTRVHSLTFKLGYLRSRSSGRGIVCGSRRATLFLRVHCTGIRVTIFFIDDGAQRAAKGWNFFFFLVISWWIEGETEELLLLAARRSVTSTQETAQARTRTKRPPAIVAVFVDSTMAMIAICFALRARFSSYLHPCEGIRAKRTWCYGGWSHQLTRKQFCCVLWVVRKRKIWHLNSSSI